MDYKDNALTPLKTVYLNCTVCFQMLGTFLRNFLDEISAYALDFWYGEQVLRRRTFYRKNYLKNVTNI